MSLIEIIYVLNCCPSLLTFVCSQRLGRSSVCGASCAAFFFVVRTANCTSRAQLDETDFQGLIESGPGAVIPWKPASVIQHDLCRHLSTPQSARCTRPSFTWDCDSLAPHDPSAISILKNARKVTESPSPLCLLAVDGRTPDVIGYTYGRAIPGFLFCIPGIKGGFCWVVQKGVESDNFQAIFTIVMRWVGWSRVKFQNRRRWFWPCGPRKAGQKTAESHVAKQKTASVKVSSRSKV